MYIIVSNNPRVPIDLDGFQVEKWSSDEFIERASSDDGIEIDEGIWYDISCLTADIYEALGAYAEAGIELVYYRFEDTPNINFPIKDKVKTYSVKPVAPPPPPMPEPEPDPVYEPPQKPAYTPPPAPEPVYTPPPQPEPTPVPTYTPPQQTAPPNPPPAYNSAPFNQDYDLDPAPSSIPIHGAGGIANIDTTNKKPSSAMGKSMFNILQYDDFDVTNRQSKNPAKVILFGSSKGGTGKTFTCLISAYWYAKTHPKERVALADFDVIDGQIGINLNKLMPTMQDFYKVYKGGNQTFSYLENCKVKSDHFSPNIDFYLAPSQDIPTVTEDSEYWATVFELLIKNYDVVFFDSGIDYLGKAPISMLYKIADKIIITCNPSINSVKSVIKQFKTLSGQRRNNVFSESDDILNRVNVVLTRVYDNNDITEIVVHNISNYAPVINAFGNIDDIISQVQWYQRWNLIDENKSITDALENITSFN